MEAREGRGENPAGCNGLLRNLPFLPSFLVAAEAASLMKEREEEGCLSVGISQSYLVSSSSSSSSTSDRISDPSVQKGGGGGGGSPSYPPPSFSLRPLDEEGSSVPPPLPRGKRNLMHFRCPTTYTLSGLSDFFSHSLLLHHRPRGSENPPAFPAAARFFASCGRARHSDDNFHPFPS